jgi:hypothetical protein
MRLPPGESFVSSLRSTTRSLTCRVDGRHARIPLEGHPSDWCEIQNIHSLRSRAGHTSLNSGVADGDVFPNEIVGTDGSGDVNAVGVPAHRIFLDHVAAGAALHPDPKVVRGV